MKISLLHKRQSGSILMLLGLLLVLSSCGLKDDLYIPTEEASAADTPATTTDEQNAANPDADEESPGATEPAADSTP